MKRRGENIVPAGIFSAVCALCTAAIILLGSVTAAKAALDSALFRQSRFLTILLSNDSSSLAGAVANPRTLGAVTKFIGAVTDAYISFEMIPVNEAGTFIAIFESLNDDVEIEDFAYRGKTLTITGTASGRAEYFRFYRALESSGHFLSINGHQYITVDDTVRFEIDAVV